MRVEVLSTQEMRDELYRLRFEAWKTRRDLTPEYPDGRLTDPYDQASVHLGIREQRKLVAGASIHTVNELHELPEAELIEKYLKGYEPPFQMYRRLVVDPAARGRGYASVLDKAIVEHVLDHTDTGTALVVFSSAFRLEKLLRLGFKQACPIGDFHTYPGGPCTVVIARHQDLAMAMFALQNKFGAHHDTRAAMSAEVQREQTLTPAEILHVSP